METRFKPCFHSKIRPILIEFVGSFKHVQITWFLRLSVGKIVTRASTWCVAYDKRVKTEIGWMEICFWGGKSNIIDLHRREGILMFKDVSRNAFVISCRSRQCTFSDNLPNNVVFLSKTTVTKSQSLSRREMSMLVSSLPKYCIDVEIISKEIGGLTGWNIKSDVIPNSMLNVFEMVAKYGTWMFADNNLRLMAFKRTSFSRISCGTK